MINSKESSQPRIGRFSTLQVSLNFSFFLFLLYLQIFVAADYRLSQSRDIDFWVGVGEGADELIQFHVQNEQAPMRILTWRCQLDLTFSENATLSSLFTARGATGTSRISIYPAPLVSSFRF